jgi:hypothetical protein
MENEEMGKEGHERGHGTMGWHTMGEGGEENAPTDAWVW